MRRRDFLILNKRISGHLHAVCGWPDISNNTDETYIISNFAEELIDLVVKAFGEYYGLEIHSKIFFRDKEIFLLLADTQKEVDKPRDWVKKNC